MSTKYVYLFSEGNGKMKNLLGGKGANLAEMTNLGMPVPQGFTVTTEACTRYYEDGEKIHAEIIAEVFENLGKLEALTQKKLKLLMELKRFYHLRLIRLNIILEVFGYLIA